MFILATRLSNLGMRTEHLEEIGQAIAEALRSSLAEPCDQCGYRRLVVSSEHCYAASAFRRSNMVGG